MMKQVILAIMLVSMLVIGIMPVAAQNTPDIVSFTTSANSVGREALRNRTALIPVTWASVNRPQNSNLVFEQVLPDGRLINVELPRNNPYVASTGDGIAAPTLPDGNVTSIRLRVTLKDTRNNTVYDTAEITLPITNDGAGTSPRITAFDAPAGTVVSRAELNAGTARIPVTWTAINRPISANLVFEQILADGRVVNVELPRNFVWVNSSDRGTVAPVPPGGNATSLTLRVRLVNIITTVTYDERTIYIPIGDQPSVEPVFLLFAPTAPSIERSVVAGGNARIGVLWSLANRPANTNLVFEQVLPNGTARNAELPRDFIVVPSSGNGIVTAILPEGNVNELTYRVRLVNMRTQATLLTAQMTVQMTGTSGETTQVVTGDACYSGNFAGGRGLAINDRARVLQFNNGASLKVYANPSLTSSQTSELGASMTVRIIGGPVCIRSLTNYGTWRYWQIDAENVLIPVRGWILEYLDADPTTAGGYVYTLEEISENPQPQPVAFTSFNVSPVTVSDIQRDSTVINIAWQTNNAVNIRIEAANYTANVPNAANGSYNLPFSEITFTSDTVEIRVTATDSANNSVVRTQTITITNTRPVCEYQWEITVDTTDCANASYMGTGAYQLFDRGFMVFDPTAAQGMMVFYNDGTMAQYADNWGGRDYTIDSTPPQGNYAPERGFGYLWFSDIAVRSGLGWGAAPEVAHNVIRQSTLSGSANYITLPDGRVVRFGSGRWQMVD